MGEYADKFLLISEYETNPIHKKLAEYREELKGIGLDDLLLGPAGKSNGMLSWTLVPSGSKIGWDVYQAHQDVSNRIKTLCDESKADWVEVLTRYSLDNIAPRIEATSKQR